MDILLDAIGKHYNQKWIFRNISAAILQGDKVSITGQNGSGKSTLMQLCLGMITPDIGKINWGVEKFNAKNFSLCAPYTMPIMEYSTLENLKFAENFKPFRKKMSAAQVANFLPETKRNLSKPLYQLSSGMVQRVKLILALFANVSIVGLDEPLSNLDSEGQLWYQQLIKDELDKTTLIVAGNQVNEFDFCTKNINLAP